MHIDDLSVYYFFVAIFAYALYFLRFVKFLYTNIWMDMELLNFNFPGVIWVRLGSQIESCPQNWMLELDFFRPVTQSTADVAPPEVKWSLWGSQLLAFIFIEFIEFYIHCLFRNSMTVTKLLLKKYLLAAFVTSRCWMLLYVDSTIAMDRLLCVLMKLITAVSFWITVC